MSCSAAVRKPGNTAATGVAAAPVAGYPVGTGRARALLESIRSEPAAILVGLVAAFVAAVDLIDGIRLDVLLDPEPSWQVVRLLLALVLFPAIGAAGILAAAVCSAVARSRWGSQFAVPLPFARSRLVVLGAVVLFGGVLLRLVGTTTLRPLYFDELSEVRPALSLRGDLSDLPPWTHAVPYREGRWGGSVGTLYLELFRVSLKTLGTTMTGVRSLSVLGGILSLFTATLLGRAFLPRGGAVLTALALAGMRWNLIMSQWGWVAMLLTPIMDLAALAMLAARRRNRSLLAGLSGSIAGVGAHVYLASWIGAAGLALWAIWPSATVRLSKRTRLGSCFLIGFVLIAFPLVREDPFGRYFSRIASRNRTLGTTTVSRMWWRLEAAEEAITGPWWTPDPIARHDLPGRSRLGWILGVALAAALLRAVLRPREELSAYLLASAVAALLASLAWGRSGTPNGFRYVYLSTTTALAAASAGLWWLAGLAPSLRRHVACLMLGAFAVSGALGARDALLDWPERRSTFDGFGGGDTLIGQAATRWDPYGTLRIDASVQGSSVICESVRESGVRPFGVLNPRPAQPRSMAIRIVGPEARPTKSEHVVERIRDEWGREYGEVIAAPADRPHNPKV